MSLINEALKKAQRQRSLDAAPLSSAPSGIAAAAVATHERAATTHRTRSNAPIWFGVGLLLLGAGTTVLIMRYGFTPAAPATVAAPPSLPPPAPAPATVAAPPLPEPLVTLPPIAPVSLAHAPAVPAPAAAHSTAAKPASAAVVAAPPAPIPVEVVPIAAPAAEEDRETQIKNFLAAVRLTGVRGQDTQARVLMNEKVYRLRDIVEPELGLRLSAVRAGLLVFTDAEGRTYEKPY